MLQILKLHKEGISRMTERKATIVKLTTSEGIDNMDVIRAQKKISGYQNMGYGIMSILYFLSNEDQKHGFSITGCENSGYTVTMV